MVDHYRAKVLMSRALKGPARRTNAATRYRVDFFERMPRLTAHPEMEPPLTWAVVERVYVEDAQAPDVLAWSRERAGPSGRFAVYVEQSIAQNDTDLLVISLIAGEDPTPPPYRAEAAGPEHLAVPGHHVDARDAFHQGTHRRSLCSCLSSARLGP